MRRDIAGQRFGRLVAISREATVRNPDGKQASFWRCICDCGTETRVWLAALGNGNTKSCGCLQRENHKTMHITHGQAHKKGSGYGVWINMRQRCLNERDPAYRHYGGRGIAMCERWNSFTNFIADMGPPPKGMSIERKDNNGPYSPENCVWETRSRQTRNRRNTVFITMEGRTQCLPDWCEELQIPYKRVMSRMRLGWSPELALTTPKVTRKVDQRITEYVAVQRGVCR